MSSKTLGCYSCKSVILSLPENEILKLNGLNFQCDCCGNQNVLTGLRFYKSTTCDPYRNVLSFENVVL